MQDDKEYFIESCGAGTGRYLVKHVFDPRHGVAVIGSVTKTDAGWTSECRDVDLDGASRTRGDACDSVFAHWQQNFSAAALEGRFSRFTQGKHLLRFTHAVKDAVVASCGREDGTRFTSTWSWDGKFSCADVSEGGVRDTQYDLVELTPEQKLQVAQRKAQRADRSTSHRAP